MNDTHAPYGWPGSHRSNRSNRSNRTTMARTAADSP